jgi:hypothetical protein
MELSDSSLNEELTPLPLLTKLSKRIFLCRQSHPPLWGRCLLFLTSLRWCSHEKPWAIAKFGLWQDTFSKSPILVNYFQLFITLPKCKTWTKSTTAMLGVNWSQPVSKIHLGLVLGRLVAWVIYSVFMMIVRTLCIMLLPMKPFGMVNALIF